MLSRHMFLGLGVLLLASSAALSDDALSLKETFKPGVQFRVTSRMSGTATLALPPDKDKKEGQSLTKTADSRIEYDERVLDLDAEGLPNKTLRVYRGIEFRKEIGKQQFRNTLRNTVRRVVLLRDKNMKVPFSPDGPMLVSEIDLIRTDVFSPSLRGLLPTNPVKPGDTWKADPSAVRELTDMQIETGGLECKFEEATKLAGRPVASVRLSGTVRGVSEDGPVRHEIALAETRRPRSAAASTSTTPRAPPVPVRSRRFRMCSVPWSKTRPVPARSPLMSRSQSTTAATSCCSLNGPTTSTHSPPNSTNAASNRSF